MHSESVEIGLTLFHGLGLMALIALIFGHIQRLAWSRLNRQLLAGLIFGLGALTSMLDPFEVSDQGVYVDGRNMFLAFGAAFTGWPGALVAAAMVGIVRFSMGGIGVGAALMSAIIAISVGLGWRRFISPAIAYRPAALALLGAGVTLTAATYALLPAEIIGPLLLWLTPLLMASSIAASIILGTFLEREETMIARERQLTVDAGTDPLTGLMNRRAFEAALGDPRMVGAGALLIVDLDRCKQVNDTHGHAAGDEVLKGVSAVLKEAVRGSDTIARFGGEEFAVYLPGALLKDARRVAERIRSSVEEATFDAGGHALNATVSVGAHWAATPIGFEEMFRPADAALYQAKNGGRNRVEFASLIASAPALAQSA